MTSSYLAVDTGYPKEMQVVSSSTSALPPPANALVNIFAQQKIKSYSVKIPNNSTLKKPKSYAAITRSAAIKGFMNGLLFSFLFFIPLIYRGSKSSSHKKKQSADDRNIARAIVANNVFANHRKKLFLSEKLEEKLSEMNNDDCAKKTIRYLSSKNKPADGRKVLAASVNVLYNVLNCKNFRKKRHFCLLFHLPNMYEIQKELDSDYLIIVPLVFQDLSDIKTPHVTTLIIDPKTHKITYIDPMGKTLYDHGCHRIYADLNQVAVKDHPSFMVVKELWEDIIIGINSSKHINSIDWQLMENLTEIQSNTVDSELHFFKIVLEYLKDKSGKKIPQLLDSKAKMDKYRSLLIEVIEDTYRRSSDTFLTPHSRPNRPKPRKTTSHSSSTSLSTSSSRHKAENTSLSSNKFLAPPPSRPRPENTSLSSRISPTPSSSRQKPQTTTKTQFIRPSLSSKNSIPTITITNCN